MVFKMVTLDLTQPYEFDFDPLLESPSHSTTLCCPAIAASSTVAGLNLRGRPKRREGHQADEDFMEFLHQQARNTRTFTFKALQVATDNFTAENMIGRGGFGKVYKGRLANGYVVAVKRMIEHNKGRMLLFQAELKVANIPKHPNVAAHLLGFCSDHKDELLLLYPFMVNRSVAWHLKERPESVPPLNWQTRMSIALGAARGLLHLHSHNIIHCDIKAANILLDHRFVPLIADFGLAIFLDEKSSHKPPPPEHITETADTVETAVRGTIGHIAPEYLSTGHCSKKNDVYGFGVMLFELITGQWAFDLARLANEEDVMLLDWVKQHLKNGTHIHQLLIDQAMEGDYEESEVEFLMMIALLCTQRNPRERPSMLQVVQFLQGSTRMDEMANIQYLMRNLLATNLDDTEDNDDYSISHVGGPEILSSDVCRPEILSGPR